MADEQPSGSCVTCFRRDPEYGYVCGPCRSKCRTWLLEIPDLFAQLTVEPLAVQGGGGKGGPVSGSRERQLPIRVDLWDLTHEGAGEQLVGVDQVGHLPVWMTLETWMFDWADRRGRGEYGAGGVQGMCQWLVERLDDACATHPAIDEFFHTIRQLRGAMRSQLGLGEPRRELCVGVPCRNDSCDLKTLYRIPDSLYIECDSCGHLLTEDEYQRWCKALVAALRRRKTVIPAA